MCAAAKRPVVTLRCSVRLEVPVATDGQWIVPMEFLEHLVKVWPKRTCIVVSRLFRLCCCVCIFLWCLSAESNTPISTQGFAISHASSGCERQVYPEPRQDRLALGRDAAAESFRGGGGGGAWVALGQR